MLIQLCDRCGRRTENKPAFLIPVPTNKGSYQVNGQWFGDPIILCNNCQKDFQHFRYTHEHYNKDLVTEDMEVKNE